MKVHLVGADNVVHFFQARGDQVTRGEPLPPDADLYFFGQDSEELRCLDRGLVILDLRAGADPGLVDRLAYADLGLVDDESARDALVETVGCEPDRLFVVVDDEALGDLVDRALAGDLPAAAVARKAQLPLGEASPPAVPDLAALTARLEALERHADVMLRDYRVRSRLPLVAWVRRNLTSHLREPYLDPTLERQVALNRQMIAILRGLLRRQAALEAQLAHEEEEKRDG